MENILITIVCYVADASTFFAFLDALATPDLRGPLESLWELGLIHTHTTLWPSLHLTKEILGDPFSRGHVEVVLQYYTVVKVLWADGDIDWLCRHLEPPMAVEWVASLPRPRPTTDWFLKCTQLPITSMEVTIWDGSLEALFPVFATLERLTVRGEFTTSLARLFAAAAQPSSKLVELDIESGCEDTMTAPLLLPMIQWLEMRPVRTFRFWALKFDPSVDATLQQVFFKALFQRPRAELCIAFNGAPWAHAITFFPFSMTSLELDGTLTPRNLWHLADVLPHSPLLTTLKLKHYRTASGHIHSEESTAALFRLLEALAFSSVQKLALDYCDLWKVDWRRLVPSLQKSTLRTLSLANNFFEPNDVAYLIHALRNNSTIKEMNLDGNDLSLRAVTALLDCNLHRATPLETLRVRIGRVHSEIDKAQLYKLAIDRGVELVVTWP
ncbi:Aste57867_18664 [Aphanomyces stellatus]|uniref:Aste57867_18664 protein n=1 Tax=Aphanomyces stellatus TaxID=120398 RepID=A0A485LB29_9STRA|nr:hypothetical protein As57867_018602 [Aphanomyces stellatus]VFT95399.1 Aste57867_18664 [Aphanomyces stellatus]